MQDVKNIFLPAPCGQRRHAPAKFIGAPDLDCATARIDRALVSCGCQTEKKWWKQFWPAHAVSGRARAPAPTNPRCYKLDTDAYYARHRVTQTPALDVWRRARATPKSAKIAQKHPLSIGHTHNMCVCVGVGG
jgi:hypothetical protein